MKYEYIGTSGRSINLPEGKKDLKNGEIFESETTIRHPLIKIHVEKKSGGRYVNKIIK